MANIQGCFFACLTFLDACLIYGNPALEELPGRTSLFSPQVLDQKCIFSKKTKTAWQTKPCATEKRRFHYKLIHLP